MSAIVGNTFGRFSWEPTLWPRRQPGGIGPPWMLRSNPFDRGRARLPEPSSDFPSGLREGIPICCPLSRRTTFEGACLELELLLLDLSFRHLRAILRA